MSKIVTDIFGVEPKIGDLIVYNPPRWKGLIVGKCVGFSKFGLPELDVNGQFAGIPNKKGFHTPKTGFVVYKN